MSDTKLRIRKATQILKEDHQAMKKLFRQYETEDEESAQRSLFDDLKTLLSVHTKIEEEIFYPAVERAEDERAGELVREAREEHGIATTLLDQLMRLDPGDDAFESKIGVLEEAVLRHAEEEESKIFPLFQDLERAEQDRVSEMLESRRRELSGDE